MKKIILCADGFGESKSISDGILDLLRKKRLSATSCMTNGPYWPVAAAQLKALNLDGLVGLHFNLTAGEPLSGNSCFAPLTRLIFRSHLGLLNQAWIAEELREQLNAFKKHYGRLPDYIDGHQHVHHLPQVREALLLVYQEYFPEKRAFIRVSSSSWSAMRRCPKSVVIAITGARCLKKELILRQIPHNTSFSGVYNFSSKAQYPQLFRAFLKDVEDGGLIMCHPASGRSDGGDPISRERVLEYHYFNSDDFLRDMLDVEFFGGKA